MECWTDPLLHYSPRRLTNKAPVRAERPVDKETAADQVLLRHRPPVAAVITVVAVVAHRKIAVGRNDKGAVRRGQEGLPGRVTPVRRLRRHHPLDALAAMIGGAGIDLEILPQDFRRRIDCEGLVIALDVRESEEKEKLPRSHILDRVLLSRNDVDVVPAEDDEFDDLFEKIRRR